MFFQQKSMLRSCCFLVRDVPGAVPPSGGSPLRTLSGPMGQLTADGTGSPLTLTTRQGPVLALPTPQLPRASPSPPRRALAPAPSPASPQLLPTWEVVHSDPRKEAALLPFEGEISLLWTVLAVAEGQAQIRTPAGKADDSRCPWCCSWDPAMVGGRTVGPGPLASWAADMLLGHPAAPQTPSCGKLCLGAPGLDGKCRLSMAGLGCEAWEGGSVGLRPSLGLGWAFVRWTGVRGVSRRCWTGTPVLACGGGLQFPMAAAAVKAR